MGPHLRQVLNLAAAESAGGSRDDYTVPPATFAAPAGEMGSGLHGSGCAPKEEPNKELEEVVEEQGLEEHGSAPLSFALHGDEPVLEIRRDSLTPTLSLALKEMSELVLRLTEADVARANTFLQESWESLPLADAVEVVRQAALWQLSL
jgi:hypothetical protein